MIPTPWTVEHLPYAGTVEDERGNETPDWGAGTTRPVYGWAPPRSDEQQVRGVESIVVSLIVYAPTFPVDARDRFVVAGETYDVAGEPETYDHGPWNFRPGMAVNLTRSE